MKSGQLNKTISMALGIEQATVSFAARKLREAGFLTTGARGVNAPDMKMRDAARLTLALMTSSQPNRMVKTFKLYRQFRNDEYEVIASESLVQLLGFEQENTVEDFLVYLFGCVSTNRTRGVRNTLLSGFEFQVHERPAYAIFKHSGQDIFFTAGHLPELEGFYAKGENPDWFGSKHASPLDINGMKIMREISRDEIELIAAGFGSE